MSHNNISTWTHYKNGWKSLCSNWKVLLIVYSMNLLLAFMALGPMSQVMQKAFEYSPLQSQFVSSFDYTLIMDFLNEYGTSLDLSTAVMVSFSVLYILWTIFYTGGYMALIQQTPNQRSYLNFWKGGAFYFFRYLRLTLYILLSLGAIAIFIVTIFSAGGTSPFALDSEEILISKLKLLSVLLLIALFVMGIFKDLAKVKIAQTDTAFINKSNLIASKIVFKKDSFFLAIINLFFLLLGLLLYLLLKKFLGNFLIPSLLIAQLFLLYRMAYKYVRLASFEDREKSYA